MLTCLIAGVVLQGQQSAPVRVHSLTGNVRRIENFASKVLGNSRTLWVYLPPDYDNAPHRRYPVMYLGDGQNLMDGYTSYIPNQEWRVDEAAESLIGAGIAEPVILVGIDNAGADRANEYLPTGMMNRDGSTWGGKADQFAKFVIEEVKPAIDGSYRTKRDAKNTGLGGSSFGGIMTLHLGLTHPEVFGKLFVHSPSLWWDSEVMLKRVAATPVKNRPAIWLDMGTKESSTAVPQTRRLEKVLVEKGWKVGRDLFTMIEGEAGHNEGAWSRRFPVALAKLFPARR